MIDVSNDFKTSVYAPSRFCKAKLNFEVVDVEASADSTPTATSNSIISRIEQITNNKKEGTKYATYEKDYFKLDGSFRIPPKIDEEGFEVGWVSNNISDENGGMDEKITITMSETHSSIGLTIHFDTVNNEYAVDFRIVVYEGIGTILDTSITDNAESIYILPELLESYDKVEVYITKLSKSYRRARILEIDFGIVQIYQNDLLIETNIIEEIDITSGQVPINQFRFTVDNLDRRFNILNPQGFYEYLQNRQKVNYELGVEANNKIEWVKMGTYYLDEWKSNEGSLTATFTCSDTLALLENYEHENLVERSISLYDLAEELLQLAEIEDYILDVELQSIMTKGIYKNMNVKELLQRIAIAGRCIFYADRQGRIVLKRINNTNVDTIDFDNIYNQPEISLDKLVYAVEVNYYSDIENKSAYKATDSNNKDGITLKIDNVLINSLQTATDVATWVLNNANSRAKYSINWRQNPALECGDTITIEDSYGQNKQSIITKQEFVYAGYLKGKTETRGAI